MPIGVYIRTEKTKRILSAAHKGKKMHPNTRAALAKALIGNTHTLGIKMPDSMRLKTKHRMMGNRLNTGRKHTEEWKLNVSKKMKGEKSHLWKGGITPINQQIRRSRKYRLWEKEIFERDNHRCQKCHRSENLVAHHILNFSTHKDLRMDINNGITFCRKCHGWFHRKYGIKHNNNGQLIEFLKPK